MNRTPNWIVVACFLVLPATAPAQVAPEKALDTFTVADGLELSLWASEPLFVNPTCIDIDHKGRVWVCESVNYRHKLRNQPPRRKEGDRIVVLEDSDNDGKADKATTFYQAPDFLCPLGVAVAPIPASGGRKSPEGYLVYVCHSPHIYLFEDKNGDLKADGKPKVLLTGFRGIDHDHGVHSVLIGPDGKLYFTVGDAGVKDLQGADGKGRKWTSNSTDCRAGTVWRCDLDGGNLELIAHNFRNNYECCVDSFGTIFLSDNDDDGNQQTRICYVMPGGNYGYHPRGRGESHWHEESPGVVPKVLRTYFGSPTGICFYEGTLLPQKYRGQLLHTDAGPRHVRCYHLKPKGAGYEAKQEILVSSTDNWFRPSDVCVAPDGSVFVADWYDPGVGGHGIGDLTRGRIYRLAPKGNKPRVPKVDTSSPDGLLAALSSPALSVRHMASAKLLVMAPREASTLLKRAASQSNNSWLKARALWLAGWLQFKAVGTELKAIINEAFASKDERFRQLVLRIAATVDSRAFDGISDEGKKKFLDDPSPGVRRELLTILREVDPDSIKSLVLDLAKQYDGKDRFYLAAIGIAVGHHDQKRREIILKDFEKYFPEWNDKVADLVWELRPPKVVAMLGKRLTDDKFPAAQRARMVDILAASEDKDAGKALLAVLQADVPAEVRDKAVENLKLYLPGKWRELRRSKELNQAIDQMLDKPRTRTTGLTLIGVANKVGLVDRVAAIAADAKEPGAVRVAAVKTLGELPSGQAASALEKLLTAEPASLRKEVVAALGELASERGRNPPGRAEALKVLQGLVSSKADLALRREAASALAGSRDGGLWLLNLHAREKLPDDLKGDVARLLRGHPHQAVRSKALAAFPPPGKLNPKKLPPIAALIKRKGNADRGRQLLAASLKGETQCLKCHSVRGVGGQIGPDLSMIGKKASRENLIESVLAPSKAVADQYVNWQVETKRGQVLNGLLVEETPDHIILRDANGKDTKIGVKEIESRTKSQTSLMPEDIVAYLSEDELIDLTEYMLTLQTPALTVSSWHIAGPFDNGAGDAGLEKAFPPEKGIDLKSRYDGKHGKVGWRAVRPDSTGYVDLQAFFAGQSGNIVSYLYAEIESPSDQEAEVLLGSDDGCKLWVNGELLHTNRQHRAAAPEQDRVKVKLKKGTNKVLLKINNGDGPHGLYFTILSAEELKPVAAK